MSDNDDNSPVVTAAHISSIFVGIVAVSFAAIFIRFCDAPPLVIAAYRTAIASLILTPLILLKSIPELKALSKNDLLLAFLAGAFLALHFALWITSLRYTSVASSAILVATNPVFVGIASHFLLNEKMAIKMAIGIAVSVVGGITIGLADFGRGESSLYGDILALAGAVMASGYLLTGRRLRQKVSLLSYIFLAYTTAAVILVSLCFVMDVNFLGYSSQTYTMFLLLAIVPQIIGHTCFNWALKYLSASFIAVSILGEPIGATTLAYFILDEALTPTRLIGGMLVLAGIYVSTRGEKHSHSPK